jgi:hypothetical protein
VKARYAPYMATSSPPPIRPTRLNMTA